MSSLHPEIWSSLNPKDSRTTLNLKQGVQHCKWAVTYITMWVQCFCHLHQCDVISSPRSGARATHVHVPHFRTAGQPGLWGEWPASPTQWPKVTRKDKISGLPRSNRSGTVPHSSTYRQFTSLNRSCGILAWCVLQAVYRSSTRECL